ncbi:hypothetical protein FY122_04045 [Dictyoglomus thermophilum]|uniref:Uncharacterized protein n=1 Tax=Dictyoglomus thermophilum TaxID=14 RepID=A0A7C2GGR7_DICTH|nr:hypothetical protein FY122_04045 [Dictyoglomus thermophilum]
MVNYLFWLISSVITIYLLLYSRGFYLKIFSVLVRDFYLINVIDKFLFIILSFFALGFIIYFESFYRKRERVKSYLKFLLVTGIQLIILFLFQFTPYLLLRTPLSYKEAILLILELILGGLFIGFYISHKKSRVL